MDTPSLVIVSGMSGAGRSTAIKALEDLDFYCVDNLPVVLLEAFVDLFAGTARRLAVVIDVREREFLDAFPGVHARLRERGLLADLLFLEASDEALAKRFDETRRVHPAADGGRLLDGIARERQLTTALAARADVILDTSQMSVHELKRRVTRRYTGRSRSSALEVDVVSFGFRYGAPEVADLMVDVRFLPNPYFEPQLRAGTGLDADVAEYVLASPRTAPFLERFFDFLGFLLPLYVEEGKAYLTIAIGCTGGRHRSVAIAGALERYLEERRIEVTVTHRDVHRDDATPVRSGGRPDGIGRRVAVPAGAEPAPGLGAPDEAETAGAAGEPRAATRHTGTTT
jgi:RNase adapter protein RapZ